MRRCFGLALVVMALTSGVAHGADEPDFFLSPPRTSISVRASWLLPSARSDWFDFVEHQLTLSRGDFTMFGIAGDVNLRIKPRLDLVFGGDYNGHSSDSEYRDFVDNSRLPIEQTTRLREGSLTGGVRYALRNRGRAVGSLAYVPTRLVPYVGGGAGVLWYDLVQYGDFVDFTNFNVFADQFPSSGAAALFYVDSGVDFEIFRHMFVTFDARYKWASADLDQETWTGFKPIDLGGLRLSTGVTFSF